MTIEKQIIENLASLARLAVDDNRVEEISERLGSVLELVDQLKATDTSGLSGLDHPLNETQRLREDIVNKPNMREAFQAIAPDTEDDLYLVPKVID
jgi:aspartyl-tRNA(Asn)/glutamyl-tRNA(Gln) amidotransferase subunit C